MLRTFAAWQVAHRAIGIQRLHGLGAAGRDPKPIVQTWSSARPRSRYPCRWRSRSGIAVIPYRARPAGGPASPASTGPPIGGPNQRPGWTENKDVRGALRRSRANLATAAQLNRAGRAELGHRPGRTAWRSAWVASHPGRDPARPWVGGRNPEQPRPDAGCRPGLVLDDANPGASLGAVPRAAAGDRSQTRKSPPTTTGRAVTKRAPTSGFADRVSWSPAGGRLLSTAVKHPLGGLSPPATRACCTVLCNMQNL